MHIFLILMSFSFLSFSYTYEEVKVKDYEEMKEVVQSYLSKTKAIRLQNLDSSDENQEVDSDEILLELKKAVQILFMRPDTDHLLSSLVKPLEVEINTYKPFVQVLEEVVKKSMKTLKSKKSSAVNQAGALYLLENTLSYSKGLNGKNADVIFSSIKKSKIKISKKLQNYLALNDGRGEIVSPSVTAKNIFEVRLEKRKKIEALLLAKKKEAARLEKIKRKKEAAENREKDKSTEK